MSVCTRCTSHHSFAVRCSDQPYDVTIAALYAQREQQRVGGLIERHAVDAFECRGSRALSSELRSDRARRPLEAHARSTMSSGSAQRPKTRRFSLSERWRFLAGIRDTGCDAESGWRSEAPVWERQRVVTNYKRAFVRLMPAASLHIKYYFNSTCTKSTLYRQQKSGRISKPTRQSPVILYAFRLSYI